MRIELKCKCGSEIVLIATEIPYSSSKKAEVYKIEKLAKEWQKKHTACWEAPAPETGE